MSGKSKARDDDERVLWMIRERASGRSSYDVAAQIDMTPTLVRTITNRVRDADAAESGEDTTGFYW